ncbi:MAG: hypothetical protein ACO1OB_09135 [Archangium sp.]
MTRSLLALLLMLAVPAYAQRDEDDAPIPYGDETTADEEIPVKKKKRRQTEIREEDEEERANEESMAGLDDPNVGVGGDIFMGLMLLDSARAGFDPRYFFGVRFTWEFGRLIPDEFLREMFFVDLAYMYTSSKNGTAFVNVDANYHNFFVAPAFALPFGKSFMSFYLQVGAGFDYSQSVTVVDQTAVSLGGTKFLFQYGVGLRGRPAGVADGTVRIQFRIEVSRFIRGYLHDMYFGGGLGLIF